MRYYETPTLSGTTDEKIRQIEDYLLRQVNDLNHNLENTTAEKIWQQTAEALTSTTAESAENKTEEQLRRDEYNSLRALVIKSATAVLKTEDAFSKTLQGAYLAQSDYGTFMENGLVNINGSPYTVAQLYKYQSTILNGVNKYKTELEGYITTGVLDRDTENPVFGMDIGYHKNKFTFNGVEYSNSAPSKIRITPNKISFCEGPYEVAYIEKKAVYFPVAHITGGSLAIGDNFSVDTKGNLTATSGSIAGFCIAGEQTAENGFWNWSLSSVVKTSSTTVNASNPEYAIFMRGQSPDGTGGAYKNNNVVFGVKERTSSETTWNAAEYNFLVRANGNLMANNAEITGTVNARNGYIGGFTVTGATSGTFWPASLASVIEPTDDSGYEYAVFLRGHYNFKGEKYGALTKANNVIGIKRRAVSSDSWDNDDSPYTFYVSLLGNIYCNTITANGAITASGNITTSGNLSAENGVLNTLWIKANSSRVSVGDTGVDATEGYSGILELLTTGDIALGKFSSKAANIYILARSTIRIGQHSSVSYTSSGTDYPSTDKVQIQAATSIDLGTATTAYRPNSIGIYAKNLYAGTNSYPCTNAYIVASNIIRIGENSDSLATANVYIRGTMIYLKGYTNANGTFNINGTFKLNNKTVSINSDGTLVAS